MRRPSLGQPRQQRRRSDVGRQRLDVEGLPQRGLDPPGLGRRPDDQPVRRQDDQARVGHVAQAEQREPIRRLVVGVGLGRQPLVPIGQPRLVAMMAVGDEERPAGEQVAQLVEQRRLGQRPQAVLLAAGVGRLDRRPGRRRPAQHVGDLAAGVLVERVDRAHLRPRRPVEVQPVGLRRRQRVLVGQHRAGRPRRQPHADEQAAPAQPPAGVGEGVVVDVDGRPRLGP